MKINEYKLTIVDGYIKGFTNDLSCEGILWEGQPSMYYVDVDDEVLSLASGCYKLVDNEIIYDENKAHQIVTELKKQKRINELKAKLNETDYIYNSIREGGRTEEYYHDVIENRKAWRREIQELEGENYD